jgi:copper transport protein
LAVSAAILVVVKSMQLLKRWPWLVAALTAVLLALSTGTGLASAHAYVLHTDPADGAVLASPPKQLQVWFSETILLDLSTFQLDDSHGHHIAIAPAHVDGTDASTASIRGRPAGPMAAAVFLDVPTLSPGAYRLSWRAVSAVDLHATTGDLVFGVQTSALPARRAATSSAPSLGETLFRWLEFGGIAGMLGALVVALVLVPHTEADGSSPEPAPSPAQGSVGTAARAEHVRRVRVRLLILASWSGAAALTSSVGLLLVQSSTAGGAASGVGSSIWFVLTGTAYGLRWEVSAALTIALIASTWFMRAKVTAVDGVAARRFLAVALALVLALLALHALQSHAAAAVDSSLLDIIAATLHLLAAAIWMGGVLALAIACIPLLRQGTDGMSLAWGTLRRFGAVALPSVVLLAVTGLYAAGRLVATPDALLLSLYGQTLLVKTGLVLAVGAIGLANAAVLHPAVAAGLGRLLRRPLGWKPFSPQHLRRTLAFEAVGAAIVVLLAAARAASQPARGPAYDPPVTDVSSASQNLYGSAADLVIVLDVKPDRPGQNFLTLGVYNTRRPAPAPITGVDVRLAPPDGGSPIEQRAASLGANQYQVAGSMITVSGDWTLTVIVHRTSLPNATTIIGWTVFPALPPNSTAPPLISRQPLAPYVDVAALVLLLLSAAAAVAFWAKKHRHTAPAEVPAAGGDRILGLVRKD